MPITLMIERLDRSGECWLWPGSVDAKGYGLVRLNGRTRRVHRVAYEHLVGPIPDGMVLDHLCRVRNCANPEHLEPVTSAVNTHRENSEAPAAINARKTHCIRNHPLSGENLRLVKGGRQCRACTKDAQHRRYLARRAA